MVNSAQAVKDKLRNISNEKRIDFNLVMRFYMYDRFIERLSKSKYRDNFILKGGFYLSVLFGIDNRNTIDIDAAVRNVEFNEDNIIKILKEIVTMELQDNIIFNIDKVEQIRDEDEYGGLRITISFSLENIKDKFHIDIATGDPIYPRPNSYKYESLIGNDVYKLLSYNLETVLAEKIETILSKLEASSRMKDYYDIYLIHKFKFEQIDKYNFRKAVEKTFEKREFDGDIPSILKTIENSVVLKERWKVYSKKNNYARNVEYEETIESLKSFIDIILLATI